MGKEKLIMILGVWVALQSFLGLPLFWDTVVYVVLGLSIVGLGILLRRDAFARGSRTSDTFAETDPSSTQEDDIPSEVDGSDSYENPRS